MTPIRLRCHECRSVFVTSADQVGRSVPCPKCGATQKVAAPTSPLAGTGPIPDEPAPTSALPTRDDTGSTTFVAKPKATLARSHKGRNILAGVLFLTSVAAVALAVGWPLLQRWWDPRPRTMVLGAAYDYLHALSGEHPEDARKFGVVADPPAIRSFRDLARDESRDRKTGGSFAPLAALHARIDKKYTYDLATGRFMPRDPIGPAAETLDALHEAKEKAERDGTYRKMSSGDPNEVFEAAEQFGAVFTKLSEGVLAPKKLIPSFRMLVTESKPPLPDPSKRLALDYASHRESWDALLGRPFPTIRADGPFQFEQAEVTARVGEKLGSAGAPPTTIRLKLVRFRLDAIDTQWKVVSARRVLPGVSDEPENEDGPDPQTPSEPQSPSPSLSPGSPGLENSSSPGRSSRGSTRLGDVSPGP